MLSVALLKCGPQILGNSSHLIGEIYNPPLELTGDRGNDGVTWEADPKAWCSWNTCVWSSNQAGKQSDYSAAAML